jgi:hypothetical protein
MSETVNYGISGVQNITAQNIAVGANSKIEQTISSGRFSTPLAELERAIAAFDGPPAAGDALLAAQAEIAGELEAPAPDKSTVLAKLASVKDLAGTAAAIVQAAAVLAHAVTTIL